MKEQTRVFGRILLGLLLAVALMSVVPELLSATNDLAVIVGIGITVTTLYLGVTNWEAILKFFKLNDEKEM